MGNTKFQSHSITGTPPDFSLKISLPTLKHGSVIVRVWTFTAILCLARLDGADQFVHMIVEATLLFSLLSFILI